MDRPTTEPARLISDFLHWSSNHHFQVLSDGHLLSLTVRAARLETYYNEHGEWPDETR